MPVYDFVCEDCGSFEARRSFAKSSDPAPCPECDGTSRRVYSMPSFVSRSEAQKEIRRREERGGEPTVGPKPENPAPKPRKSRGRPWQLGH